MENVNPDSDHKVEIIVVRNSTGFETNSTYAQFRTGIRWFVV